MARQDKQKRLTELPTEEAIRKLFPKKAIEQVRRELEPKKPEKRKESTIKSDGS